MKIKKLLAVLLILTCVVSAFASCGLITFDDPKPTDAEGNEIMPPIDQRPSNDKLPNMPNQNERPDQNDPFNKNDLPNQNDGSFPSVTPDVEVGGVGESLDNTGINNGKFEGTTTSSDFTVTYVSGTKNAYKYDEAAKTLTFTALSADSVYAISGKLNGNIVIDVGETYKLDLELTDFSLRSSSTNPIFVNSGNEIKITAKKDTKNYIYDERSTVDTTKTGVYGGAIHSIVDLEICGRGTLFVQSANNNGIQTTKDLQVKNLALTVECQDNALKGKDSVTVENCSTLLVAKTGDAIKSEASDISTNTGKQRGTVSILGGTHSLFAANDGIDAAYDVIIDNGTYIDDTTQKTVTVATILNIYTDKYSNYTKEDSTAQTPDGEQTDSQSQTLYICYPSKDYKYSVKLLNNDATKSEWVNPTYDKSVNSGRSTYYTYKFNASSEYTKMQVYIYTSSQAQQSETSYYYRSDVISIHNSYNTYKYSNSKRNWSWAEYGSLSQSGGGGGFGGGPGGMNEGNPNAVAYSAKGIKASNAVTVNAGTIEVKSTDDAIHADNGLIDGTQDEYILLENGQRATGNVTVNGGTITISSQDDGLHADGTLTVKGGNIKVLTAYEGLEGNTITVSGGDISVTSTDDGFNACAMSGTGITISGGTVYIYAGGDGIDSNSRTSKNAIAFNGGNTVIISTSGGNSAIDSDGGYKYTAGKVLAIMPQGGMTGESTNCSNFSSIGKKQSLNLSANAYATVKVNGAATVSVKMPKAISAMAVYLGSSSASISSAASSAGTADSNGVYWSK